MGPKKDHEALKKQYEAYQQTDEYKKLQQTRQCLKSLPMISQTSKDYDLDGKYQTLWDKLYELSQLMKIKPPFKKLEHEWMRSMFFGEKRKIDPNEKKCYYDGVLCQFEPTDGDSQHNLRQVLFKKIYAIIESEDSFDSENYLKSKVDVKKGLQQFYGLMKTHIKKSFKIIYDDKLLTLMQPFTDLLEINMKLVLFDMKYVSKQDRFVNNFKHKAIVDRYCVCLEKVLEILSIHHNKKVKFLIKPANIFKKLSYENLTKIEKFYLDPYREAFETLKQGLCALFATGINFWKVPLQENKNFVDDLNRRFFGNDLLRDQINFAANALNNIVKANQLAEKYLIKQDSNSMEISVPRLIAFRTILHMRNYKDKLATIETKEKEKSKMLGLTVISNHQEQMVDLQHHNSLINNSVINNSNSVVNNSTINPSLLANTKQTFKATQQNPSKTVNKQTKVSLELQTDNERGKLGRYWVWQNYCDDDFKRVVIEEASDMLQNINPAVYQDIEDSIIREGMLPKRDRQNEQLKSAADQLKNMKTLDNAMKSENMKRPPQLWNFPKVVEEEHRFRSIADPKKCYIDGRIEKLDDAIIKIGNYLKNYNHKQWNELMRRVIDFFDGKPDDNPFAKTVVLEEMQNSQQMSPQ